MDNQPMRLFLTSTGLEAEGLPSAFADFARPAKKIVLITTAALHHKAMNRNIIALHKRLAQVGDQIRLLDVELESPSILLSADLIAIGGGNPYYLLYWLRRSGADEIIQQSARYGTPIMATSAGAIVLGQSLELIDHFTPEMNSVQLTDYSGLRLIEETVLPHYDRFIKNGTIKESAVSDYEKRSGVKVIRLNDDQFYLVGDGLPPSI